LTYAASGEESVPKLAQLILWEWTGAETVPLLVKTYQYPWDSGSFHMDGSTLRIGTKEDTRSFVACGDCPEPKGIWTLRITPVGVTDLGHRFLQPELQWADELLTTVGKGENTTEIARSDVVEKIKAAQQKMRAKVQQPNEPGREASRHWSMLDSFRRLGPNSFDLKLDEVQFRFTYILRNHKPHFTTIKIDLFQ
jgi:hypothetical protein